jgi:hypothetical protein
VSSSQRSSRKGSAQTITSNDSDRDEVGDNGVCEEMKGETEEDFKVSEYLQSECMRRGDSSSSVHPTAVADRAAIDRILSEHRSDIIRLGFLRHHHRNSRLSTPMTTTPSSSSPYGRNKGRGVVEAFNEWINSANTDNGNSKCDENNSDREHSNNEDFDMSDEDNEDNHCNTEINAVIGRIENRTAVKQVSQFLERRLSEIEKSKIIQKNNIKKTIKKTTPMKKVKARPHKNNADTNILFETTGLSKGKTRETNSKSPFWIDNGEEVDEMKIYLKLPRIVDKKIEEREKEKVDEDAYSLSPRKSRRYYYQNLSSSSGQQGVGSDSDDDGDRGRGRGRGVDGGVGDVGGEGVRDGDGVRVTGSNAISDDLSMSDSDEEEEEEDEG